MLKRVLQCMEIFPALSHVFKYCLNYRQSAEPVLLFLPVWPLVPLFHCSLDSGNKQNSILINIRCAFSFVITLLSMAFCHTQAYIMFHCPTRYKVTEVRDVLSVAAQCSMSEEWPVRNSVWDFRKRRGPWKVGEANFGRGSLYWS